MDRSLKATTISILESEVVAFRHFALQNTSALGFLHGCPNN